MPLIFVHSYSEKITMYEMRHNISCLKIKFVDYDENDVFIMWNFFN